MTTNAAICELRGRFHEAYPYDADDVAEGYASGYDKGHSVGYAAGYQHGFEHRVATVNWTCVMAGACSGFVACLVLHATYVAVTR